MSTKNSLLAGLVVLLMAGSANAALLSRAGGQAYYDDVLNITWVADANLAASNTFGVAGINFDGLMTWDEANEWIAAMNSANYLGVSNWRLPNIIDTGTSGCNFAYTGTDCGYNVDLATSEMAHLFYSTLGNTGNYDTSASLTGCAGSPNYCLTNTGPFANLKPYYYWSGTTYVSPSSAWDFSFGYGYQYYGSKSFDLYAWAVRDGDVSAIPIPAAVWLFGSALGVMGWLRRKVAS